MQGGGGEKYLAATARASPEMVTPQSVYCRWICSSSCSKTSCHAVALKPLCQLQASQRVPVTVLKNLEMQCYTAIG